MPVSRCKCVFPYEDLFARYLEFRPMATIASRSKSWLACGNTAVSSV